MWAESWSWFSAIFNELQFMEVIMYLKFGPHQPNDTHHYSSET